ncbi:MAG: glycosyltransferase family 4 protein [Thermoleophilia bacterium]|nr:glycosyltransferase family 4 protein [Thermoleophilia bacterium]
MIHVLLDCRMAGWSGVGRYTTGLARALAVRGDIRLAQVCAPANTPPVPAGATAQIVIAEAHPFSVRGAVELGRLTRRVEPDVVHCPHFPTPVRSRGPLVVTLHDLIPLIVPGVMPSALRRSVYRRCNARAVHLADQIVVPSCATAADVARLFPTARGRLMVTAEAADDFSSGPIEPLTGSLSDLVSSPYLFSMGNTRPHKGLPTLLAAFARLAAAEPSLRLLLAGVEVPGYLDAELAGEPQGLRARVAFTGLLGQPELKAVYAGALAYVCPSHYEGFGLPALEAMTLGTPVVCADAASLPEVVGDAALMFPPGDRDALTQLLTRVLYDRALREELSRAGLKRAARFTWERTAAATLGAYEEAVRHHGRGS